MALSCWAVYSPPPDEALHVSSFGVIPKKDQPGKWRLIIDLSSPWGHSVNDGIDPEKFSLQYIKMTMYCVWLRVWGKGALLAKFDVENAYRNVPVHPDDRAKLGMKWRKQLYVDLMLPFGLRSAPFIFDSIAEVVEWILTTNYSITDLLHYLDEGGIQNAQEKSNPSSCGFFSLLLRQVI